MFDYEYFISFKLESERLDVNIKITNCRDPVVSVGISVSEMVRSVNYWNQLLGMEVSL